MQGYVQVYTGNGKGKSTAAFGLALRAAGAGLRVFIAQFVKGMEYSELEAFKRLDDLVVLRQFGRGCFICGEPVPEDYTAARAGLAAARSALVSGAFDLIILDEVNIATYYQLFPVDELLALINERPPSVELVLTGRNADERVLAAADLVTEMREVRHYYQRGVSARRGIEH